jgi:hypothetical protein
VYFIREILPLYVLGAVAFPFIHRAIVRAFDDKE